MAEAVRKLELSGEVAALLGMDAAQLLEGLGTNVLIADESLRLVYMNERSRRTFDELAPVLQSKYRLEPHQLLGRVIDGFHADPNRVRGLLRDMRAPHRADIALGNRWLNLNVAPLREPGGALKGYIVNWEDVTAKKELELEAHRVSEMMRQMPLNVMLCDHELRLTYMNETSRNTLRSLEHSLPRKVDEMLGQTIDIFHKKPEHQRRLLADPRRFLPMEAEIKLGGEDVRLRADGIWDKSGGLVGLMATWTVITEQKKLARENAEAQERERAAAADLRDKVEQLLQVTDAAGQGDLTVLVPFTGEDSMGQLADGLQNMLDRMAGSLREIDSGANEIDVGASQVAMASQSLAEGSTEQAAQLQTITQQLDEMTKSTRENARRATEASKSSAESQAATSRGLSEMDVLADAMKGIRESASRVSDIIGVINEIAFQTNLLALNAAVEAARAGDAGRGFAVVAEEVRNLAGRSAQAARNTTQMIEEAGKRAQHGVEIAARVGHALQAIAESARQVDLALGAIAQASREQAEGVKQISSGVTQLDQVTQQTAGNAEELAAAAEETSSQVAAVRDLVAQFQLDVYE